MLAKIDENINFFTLLDTARKRYIESLDYSLNNSLLNISKKEHFSLIISAAIDTCKITQKELGDLFGVHKTTVSRWVNGDLFPRKDKRAIYVQKLRAKIVSDLR